MRKEQKESAGRERLRRRIGEKMMSMDAIKLHWRAPLQTKGFLKIIEFVSLFVLAIS